MKTIKAYIIKIGYNEFLTEDKEKAHSFLEMVSEFQEMRGKKTYGEERSFYYPEEIESDMKIRTIEMFQDKFEATKAKTSWERAKKMGLIWKKKGKKGKSEDIPFGT